MRAATREVRAGEAAAGRPRGQVRVWFAAALIGLLAVTLSSCGSSTDSRTDGATNRAADSSITNGIAVGHEAFQALASEPDAVVLDVRTPQEFAAGHLPDAVNLDVEAADFAGRIAELDKTKPYAVYCHSGNRSAGAVQQMLQAGFTHVNDLEGGIVAWQAAGGQVVTP